MAMKQVTAGDVIALLEKERNRFLMDESHSAIIAFNVINKLLTIINSLAYCPSCDSIQETEGDYDVQGIYSKCMTCGEKID